MSILFHADDFGITVKQAQSMLALSSACGGKGALTSVSAFANSPAFEEAAALALPYVSAQSLRMGLHVNLVEGCPCLAPQNIPLLVGSRGTFTNDFTKLLALSRGTRRIELQRQIQHECCAQIERYLAAFPATRNALRIDSHQHTHAIPLVFDALLAAVQACDCTLEHMRTPVEPLKPHLSSLRTRKHLSVTNLIKGALLSTLWRKNQAKLPKSCSTSVFCGVLLSGKMEFIDQQLLQSFEDFAAQRPSVHHPSSNAAKHGEKQPMNAVRSIPDTPIEVLFHPISVPIDACLDPENMPFAKACSSPSRSAEALALSRL